ncbi:MAG: hypothetical protein RhofKO_43250 [Rhodothermales bacterium]
MSDAFVPLDYSHMKGGLVRMMDRHRDEGTLTGDLDADQYLRDDPNAALLGLLYDQRVRAEYAFTGPIRLRDRLGHLDLKRIAAMDLDELRGLFEQKPAVHRFTNVMAENTLKVAKQISEHYEGNAANLWNDGADFATIQKRVRALPGFGEQKSAKMRYVLHYFGHRSFAE